LKNQTTELRRVNRELVTATQIEYLQAERWARGNMVLKTTGEKWKLRKKSEVTGVGLSQKQLKRLKCRRSQNRPTAKDKSKTKSED